MKNILLAILFLIFASNAFATWLMPSARADIAGVAPVTKKFPAWHCYGHILVNKINDWIKLENGDEYIVKQKISEVFSFYPGDNVDICYRTIGERTFYKINGSWAVPDNNKEVAPWKYLQ